MKLKTILLSIAALAISLQFQTAQAENPKVKMETSKGDIIIDAICLS